MMKIVNIGMNHESAPIELRECLARDKDNIDRALASMRESQWIHEGLFLSTCNRIEAIYTTESAVEAEKWAIGLFSRLSHLPEEQFTPNLYIHEDIEAIRHVFRVASSLDSMIVGEPQILGQIKEAYHKAVAKEKTSGVIINRLMHRAFHVAKRIRTETRIAEAAVSISYAAVELAKKIFYELNDKKVLLIGAGEMAELAARHLLNHGIESFVVANRSFEKAVQIAETFHGKAVFLEEIEALLLEVDIIISSTASTEYVIHYEQVKQCLRKRRNRPLFFIDIAVPRDVDPRVNELGNVYLYDIDDLKGIIEVNTTLRKQESIKAERIITEEVIRFKRWLETLDIVPTIISLKDKVEAIRKAEVKKSLSGLRGLTPSQEKAMESLTVSLAEKIIHDPILVLKERAGRSSKDAYLDIVKKLFKLDDVVDERISNGS
ncbi:MAG: glutamyl-tRNA reductase [Deltaproteobacteria bacterium]|nr:glutamyl-tRNA reductase [Deltaproteobacteria bacterium]